MLKPETIKAIANAIVGECSRENENFERIRISFKACTPRQMQAAYGESGLTRQQIYDGALRSRDAMQAAWDDFEAFRKLIENPAPLQVGEIRCIGPSPRESLAMELTKGILANPAVYDRLHLAPDAEVERLAAGHAMWARMHADALIEALKNDGGSGPPGYVNPEGKA